MSISLFLNPYIFFLVKDGNLILWDYKNHSQFIIEQEHLVRILSRSANLTPHKITAIDEELLENGVLSKTPFIEPKWGWDELSKIFHVGTRKTNEYGTSPATREEWIDTYLDHCQAIASHQFNPYIHIEGEKTPLSPPNLDLLAASSFLNTLKNRFTCRNFDGQAIDEPLLSTILFTCFGLFHGPWEELRAIKAQELGYRKSSPSGGGLHPLEAFVVIKNVNGINPGIYHYNILSHALIKVNDAISDPDLIELLAGQYFVEGIAFGVFLVAYLEKIWWKYFHSRAYRVALLDAGHLSQTFLLTATAAKLLPWLTADFNDEKVSATLKVNGMTQIPLHFLAAGHGEKLGINPLMIKRAKQRKASSQS
jgi:SagB-type dehydrogenase family enzyme